MVSKYMSCTHLIFYIPYTCMNMYFRPFDDNFEIQQILPYLLDVKWFLIQKTMVSWHPPLCSQSNQSSLSAINISYYQINKYNFVTVCVFSVLTVLTYAVVKISLIPWFVNVMRKMSLIW